VPYSQHYIGLTFTCHVAFSQLLGSSQARMPMTETPRLSEQHLPGPEKEGPGALLVGSLLEHPPHITRPVENYDQVYIE